MKRFIGALFLSAFTIIVYLFLTSSLMQKIIYDPNWSIMNLFEIGVAL